MNGCLALAPRASSLTWFVENPEIRFTMLSSAGGSMGLDYALLHRAKEKNINTLFALGRDYFISQYDSKSEIYKMDTISALGSKLSNFTTVHTILEPLAGRGDYRPGGFIEFELPREGERACGEGDDG
eukprot:scaffold28468_cov26-Tisochrysis_lutea.AAC.2